MTGFRPAYAALALTSAALLTLAGCAGGGDTVAGTTWGDPDKKDTPSLTFDSDGSLGGTDGCNVVGGDWTQEGPTITFGPLISTMMYCEGIDDWLTHSATAVVSGDTMTFSDEDGKELGRLTRN